MGRTALILLVCGADVIYIFLFACRHGLANHTGTAITTEKHSAEKPDCLAVWTAAGIAFEHLLNAVKINLGDNRFVAVVYDCPLAFIFGNTLVNLVARCGLLALYENSGINGVL